MPRFLVPLLIAVAGGSALTAAVGATSGAFSGQTSNDGSAFQAAASFGCSSPSIQTVQPAADTYVSQASATTNYGTSTIFGTRSHYESTGPSKGPRNVRSLIRFDLPAIPSGCQLSSAFLRADADSAAAGRTLQVLRAASAWSETGAAWSNQPATTGTAVTATPERTWVQWDVTSHVSAMYQGANDGWLVRDSAEDSSTEQTVVFYSRESSSPRPQLVVTFAAAPCPTPSARTIVTGRDAPISQRYPDTNYATNTFHRIRSLLSENVRTLVHFHLPTVPADCRVVVAGLRLYDYSPTAGRTLEALRIAAPWTETGVTWSNQPGTTGTAAAAAAKAGWVEWGVKSQIEAMYQGANEGFLLRDSVEDAATQQVQDFYSREGSTTLPPKLSLLIG